MAKLKHYAKKVLKEGTEAKKSFQKGMSYSIEKISDQSCTRTLSIAH